MRAFLRHMDTIILHAFAAIGMLLLAFLVALLLTQSIEVRQSPPNCQITIDQTGISQVCRPTGFDIHFNP